MTVREGSTVIQRSLCMVIMLYFRQFFIRFSCTGAAFTLHKLAFQNRSTDENTNIPRGYHGGHSKKKEYGPQSIPLRENSKEKTKKEKNKKKERSHEVSLR